MAEELDVTLLPYELAGGMEVTREVIRQIKSGQSVGIFIGPEGGFEPEEVDAAVSMGRRSSPWQADPADRDSRTCNACCTDV